MDDTLNDSTKTPLQSLSGKTYLITGASFESEIGLAICQTLSEQGARLILSARDEALLEKCRASLTGGTHIVEPFDLTALDEIKSWIKSLILKNGPVDGLVHNASFQGYSPLKTINAKQISQYFDVNFSAAALLIAAVSKKGHCAQGASLVMIGSAAGLKGLKARALYAASKAALLSLTKSAALELADKHIRVNYVAPAVVTGSKSDLQFASLPQEQAQLLKSQHPLGLSTPQDVANSVLFLISNLSRNITGISLSVDGGYSA